ncbi:heat shock 70 kDa protein 3-like [Dendrobium catenatum]|uniref:Heat shock 70 kDa protein 18 n=1 Tax=Dendrobium catenatum TaxID=906689 RepID=A0A2I0VP13_9ASPA|nr:heat shock 70 kDa protein 3-like [Dendrobium catenatum]PKU65151.1 Heat shock 70 kDa protein 18 [Dendrobium catenatum]
MENPSQISCSGNCLVHLHSAAGKAWMYRHACPIPQYVGPDGIPRFLVVNRNNEEVFLSAHEIRTLFFLISIASIERLFGSPVPNLMAIIPSNINPVQYHSQLSAAADDAGARIVLSIQRSVLAASYYESITPGCRTVLVFEFGGHILEISLLTEDPCLNIRASVSDMGCPLFKHVVSVLPMTLGNAFTSDADSLHKIRNVCERAKEALCLGSRTVVITFERLGRETRIPIDREWLVRMNLNHLRSGIMRCLMEAGVRRDTVDEVVLAGASSNMPAVRSVLLEFFQEQTFRCSIDPANLIEVSSLKCMDIVSNALNIPVVRFQALNLGLYSL